jgi:hypothetical protein
MVFDYLYRLYRIVFVSDKGFEALQNVFIVLQKLANRTKKKQLKKCVKTLTKAKI